MADEPLKTAVLTDVGIAKLDAAYQAGTKITIAEMALGDSNLEYVVPDPAFTQLVNEFGRQPINEGNTSDTWINAIVYVDSQQFSGHSILEFGLYDDEGDLIVYSSYTPSVVPSVGQDYIQLEIECSVDLYNASAVTIEVTPIYPQATELERGIAKIATAEDVAAGVDDEKIVTAKKLKDSANKSLYSTSTDLQMTASLESFNFTSIQKAILRYIENDDGFTISGEIRLSFENFEVPTDRLFLCTFYVPDLAREYFGVEKLFDSCCGVATIEPIRTGLDFPGTASKIVTGPVADSFYISVPEMVGQSINYKPDDYANIINIYFTAVCTGKVKL